MGICFSSWFKQAAAPWGYAALWALHPLPQSTVKILYYGWSPKMDVALWMTPPGRTAPPPKDDVPPLRPCHTEGILRCDSRCVIFACVLFNCCDHTNAFSALFCWIAAARRRARRLPAFRSMDGATGFLTHPVQVTGRSVRLCALQKHFRATKSKTEILLHKMPDTLDSFEHFSQFFLCHAEFGPQAVQWRNVFTKHANTSAYRNRTQCNALRTIGATRTFNFTLRVAKPTAGRDDIKIQVENLCFASMFHCVEVCVLSIHCPSWRQKSVLEEKWVVWDFDSSDWNCVRITVFEKYISVGCSFSSHWFKHAKCQDRKEGRKE